MIEIKDKAFVPQSVYFPKSIDINLESYDLVLTSELMQKSYTFSGLTDESKSKNYFKFSVDFSEVDDAEYNYTISNTCTGLIRIGEIEDQLPDRYNYTPFTEEDSDNEIVQYYPNGNFKYRFQPNKIVEIVENGVVDVKPDSGYTALLNVEIHTDVAQTGHTDEEIEQAYESGYTSGVTDGVQEQKAKLTSTAVTENGTYSRPDGYNSVNVNVPVDNYYNSGYTSGYTDGFNTGYTSGCTDGYKDGYGDGFESGKTDGIQEQKAKLISTAITSNGTYNREDGYNSVSVNIAQTGHTDEEMEQAYNSGVTEGTRVQKAKLISTAVTSNGTYSRPDGYNSVNVNIPVDDYYNSGYTSGKTDGVQEQKAKLVTTAFTQNGTFTKEDGYKTVTVNVPTGETINNQTKSLNITENGTSAVTFDNGYTGLQQVNVNVNIAQTGHTDEEITQAYNSGVTYQKSLLVSTAITENGTYTRTDGYNSVSVNIAQTGHTDQEIEQAYNSGITEGTRVQKAKLTTTAVTSNGTYARPDGYSSIEVNVPTGSTIVNQTKTVNVTVNGSSAITFDNGYTGLEKVNLNVNIQQTGHTDQELEQAYNSGYTSGVTYQKSLLISTAVTTNGTYSRPDGYSSIEVNVPDRFQDGYTSGYTDGYEAASSGGSVQYFLLTVNVGSDIEAQAYKLNGNAAVTVTYGSSSSTQTYNGSALVFQVLPGFNYSVSFGSVTDFNSPSSITGMSTWGGSTSVIGNYEYIGGDIPYDEQYLTFEIVSGGTIQLNAKNSLAVREIDYSINNGEWISKKFDIYSWDNTISGLTAGDKIRFRGNNNTYSGDTFSGNVVYNVYGNINSIVKNRNFNDVSAYTQNGVFYELFKGSKVINAQNLKLSTTTLSNNCYQGMFQDCTKLTTAPALPATTLTEYCYYSMFNNCTSLTTTPALPATTLANNCYNGMFTNCTGLTTAPSVLPATTLANDCYNSMFYYCKNLTTAPSLPATTLAGNCYNSMFYGCTGLTTAPELPATTLIYSCYQNMFRNCSNINYIKCLATDISASSCLTDWVLGVANSGTFVKAATMEDWVEGSSGYPTGWTVQNAQ